MPVPGLVGAQRPVGVLAVEEELGIEHADLLQHLTGDEHRGAASAVRLDDLVEAPVVLLAVASLAAVVPGARVEARPGEPDQVAGIGVEDLAAERPGIGTAARLVDERTDERRVDLDVVVQTST